MPRTFSHTHDANHLTVAHSSLFNSHTSTSTTTKSTKHFKTLNGGVAAPSVASPSSSSSSDVFDAVKDAERKAKNAASAKKSRQKKNRMEATRDKQVEEMEMGIQKLNEKINKTQRLINAMSSLVLDVKLQNLFGDSTTTHTHGGGTTTSIFSPEHGSFHQQMEQETYATNIHHHHHHDVDEGKELDFNLPLFDLLNGTSTTATSHKEVVNENHNAVIKATDETKYSVEEAPLEIQQNDQSINENTIFSSWSPLPEQPKAYRVRNMNEFDDEYVDENTNDNDNGFSSLTDVDCQINIDLNVALANSDFLLQRLNSTVSRMSLDEDVCLLDIADERDLLHEQLPLDTYENLMLEIQHEYA